MQKARKPKNVGVVKHVGKNISTVQLKRDDKIIFKSSRVKLSIMIDKLPKTQRKNISAVVVITGLYNVEDNYLCNFEIQINID